MKRVKTPLLKGEELRPLHIQLCWEGWFQLEVPHLKSTSPCRTLHQGQDELLGSLGQIRERSGNEDLEWSGKAS